MCWGETKLSASFRRSCLVDRVSVSRSRVPSTFVLELSLSLSQTHSLRWPESGCQRSGPPFHGARLCTPMMLSAPLSLRRAVISSQHGPVYTLRKVSHPSPPRHTSSATLRAPDVQALSRPCGCRHPSRRYLGIFPAGTDALPPFRIYYNSELAGRRGMGSWREDRARRFHRRRPCVLFEVLSFQPRNMSRALSQSDRLPRCHSTDRQHQGRKYLPSQGLL